MAASTNRNKGSNFELTFTILKRVVRTLMDGKMPPDDTIMHNFIDCLKRNGFSPEDVIKTELDSFANSVVNGYNQYDPSIVSFAINIQGWLVEDPAFYCTFSQNVTEAFSRVCRDTKSGNMCETVILTSLFDCFIPLSKHKGGMKWIVHEGMVLAGLKLLNSCPSIFLEKTIIDFICCVVEQLGCTSVECIPIFENIQSDLDTLVKQKTTRPFAAASLKLLEKLCINKPALQTNLLTSHSCTINSLFTLLFQPYNKNSEAVVRIIGDVFKQWSQNIDHIETNIMESFISQTENTLSDLVTGGNIEQAQKLAACCLNIKPDSKLYIKCCQLHQEPVYWMFGVNKDLNLLSEVVVRSIMKDRSRCISIISQALDSNVLPVTVVIKILRCTLIPGEHIDGTLTSYVLNNTKIQRKCLEYLIKANNTTITDKDGICIKEEHTAPVCQVLLDLYKNDESYSMISSLCGELMIKHLPYIIYDDNMSQDLSDIIQHHLSAVKWEHRDNTVELVGKIVHTYKDNFNMVEWLMKCRLPNLIWFSLKDNESYVRASAVASLFMITQCSQLFDNLKDATSLTEDDVLMEIINMVKTDTEAFARRSAMKFLFEFFKSKSATSERQSLDIIPWVVVECIALALKDFDWEVKIAGLKFVLAIFTNLILDQSLGKDSADLHMVESCNLDRNLTYITNILCYQNFYDILIGTLDDCDNTVCEKSLHVFTEIQSVLNTLIHGFKKSTLYVDESCCSKLSKEKDEPSSYKKMKYCNCPSRDDNARRMNTSLENSDRQLYASNGSNDNTDQYYCDKVKDKDSSNSNDDVNKCSCYNEKRMCNNRRETYVSDTLKKIAHIDLTVYKKRLNHDEDTVTKLLSISDDILSYTTTLCDGKEKISDCY
ncbi:BRCA1-associated ATM activator 1 [Mactra antiquata]